MTGQASAPSAGLPPVVDAHVHFWDPSRLHYPWLAGAPALQRRFGPGEFADASRAAPVERIVFVECNCASIESADEVGFVESLRQGEPRIAGIVAYADLTDVAPLAPRLDALLARSPVVKGIRHNIQGHPSGFCLQPRFVEGVREVGARGLVFDLCITHDQLPEVIDLVERTPEVRYVLDHGGKPAIRDGRLDAWAGDIGRLASAPNVACKLSGLLTEAAREWSEGDIEPYARHLVEGFGSGRVLFGSDWPLVTLAGRYGQWLDLVDRLTTGHPDRAGIFGGNATRIYGLT